MNGSGDANRSDTGTTDATRPGAPASERLYAAFGHGLASSIELPELRLGTGMEARWRFGLLDAKERSFGGELLGSEPLYEDVSARLFRHEDGFRIEVDDTGVYELSMDGSRIRWLPRDDPWWDFGRGHLLGRVLSTSMHFDGLLVLHASAVETSEGTVAFLGMKGSGKTTLALSMVDRGARLVTDDTLPVVPDERRAWPGIQSLRLTPAAAAALVPDEHPGVVGRDGKVVTRPLPLPKVATGPTDLCAIYIVEPAVMHDPDRAVARTGLDPLRATAALAAHAKIGAMLGRGEMATVLDRASRVATEVPVRVLAVHRDEAHLPDIANGILDWHRGPAED